MGRTGTFLASEALGLDPDYVCVGKALGGGTGGYTAGRRPIIDWLRQRSRPYLFSNSIPPAMAAASLKVLEILAPAPKQEDEGLELRTSLWSNAQFFREAMTGAGFKLAGAGHPIIPVILGDAKLASEFARRLASALFSRAT